VNSEDLGSLQQTLNRLVKLFVKLSLSGANEMAEWALVVVGAITLLAIWYQARETSRSAKAAQKSVELQERLHQQWVDVEHWKGDADFPSDDNQVRLKIGFDVLNLTSMPLTLDSIQATITSSRNTENLSGHLKTGQRWSGQNRPTEVAGD
jgi:hypothetical protein